MERLIACCGIDCATCDARIATLTNDNALREKTAKKWEVQFSIPNLPIEMINCMGCREGGVKFSYCSSCEIRNCVRTKGYQTCGDCSEMDACSIVGAIHQYMPELRENLKSLK